MYLLCVYIRHYIYPHTNTHIQGPDHPRPQSPGLHTSPIDTELAIDAEDAICKLPALREV